MRTWTHQKLISTPAITALLGEGVDSVIQFRSLDSVPQVKPFLSHRMGVARSIIRDDNATKALTTPLQVWVHDNPGDYLAIDALLEEVRKVLEAAPSSGKFIQARFLEHSEDLADPEMGTILRFSRYLLVHKP